MSEPGRALRELARLWGVQLSHVDGLKIRRRTSAEGLVGVLRGLGAPMETPDDAPEALRARHAALARRTLAPAAVAWDGTGTAALQLPRHRMSSSLGCTLRLDTGEERSWRHDPRVRVVREIDGAEIAATEIPVGGLPIGYHRLEVEGAGRECLVISAPSRAFAVPGARWGVFAPTYALRREGDWGVGDYTALLELGEWVHDLGGHLVATLPPLAAFLDEPFDPSPYAPVSRRHWNEALVDVERAPELARSERARELLARAAGRIRELSEPTIVDHRRVMAVKRPVLEALAETFFAGTEPEGYGDFSRESDLEDYARFRAACERHGAGWGDWPRAGAISEGDADPAAIRYHRYVQWLAESQLRAASAAGLYLDLPLGVHPQGFETWQDGDLYPDRVAAGAPADLFSLAGQIWGFPPMRPETLRDLHHRPFIAAVRTLLRHARALRVDHVMGLHRLFWVPEDLPAVGGTYVRYPRDELYAILSLESHRRGAVLVGEDLGTVPATVRATLRRRRISRMYVTQTEARTDRTRVLAPVPRRAQASLNTHDMFPFRAFWEGADVAKRVQVGILPPDRADAERVKRARLLELLAAFWRNESLLTGDDPSPSEALDAGLAHLAASGADLVLVNLEDLWEEVAPQNIPGTTDQYPNWRRRLPYPLSAVRMMGRVVGRLEEVDRLRRKVDS